MIFFNEKKNKSFWCCPLLKRFDNAFDFEVTDKVLVLAHGQILRQKNYILGLGLG
jgi:hypothetical protein